MTTATQSAGDMRATVRHESVIHVVAVRSTQLPNFAFLLLSKPVIIAQSIHLRSYSTEYRQIQIGDRFKWKLVYTFDFLYPVQVIHRCRVNWMAMMSLVDCDSGDHCLLCYGFVLLGLIETISRQRPKPSGLVNLFELPIRLNCISAEGGLLKKNTKVGLGIMRGKLQSNLGATRLVIRRKRWLHRG